MGSIATPARTTSEIVTAMTDPTSRWTVHAGNAPATATSPFVSIYYDVPTIAGLALDMGDQGQVRARWRINGFGASVDQARWLLGAVLLRITNMVDVQVDTISAVTRDPTEEPALFMWSVTFRDYQVETA
jgi:hypothetical protein